MTRRTRIDLATLRKIWLVLTRPQRRSAAVLMGLLTLGMVFETLGVGLVMPAFVLLTQRNLANYHPAFQVALDLFGNPGPRGLVLAGVLMLVGVYLVKAIFLALVVRYQAHFVFGVQAELSQRLFHRYLFQPYSFHLRRNSAQLIHNVDHDTGVFAMSGVQATVTLFSEALVLTGLATLLLVVEPFGTSVMMCILAVAAWVFNRLTGGFIARSGAARRHHHAMRLKHLQEGLGAVKDAKLRGREAEFLQRYRDHDSASSRAGAVLTTLQQLPRLWLELLAVVGFAALVVSLVVQGRALETVVATVALFAAAVFRLIPSVNRILGALQSLAYGASSISALHAEFDLPTPSASRGRGRIGPLRESLQLNSIEFTHAGTSARTLAGLSMQIRRGECVGLVGASGAGKSTLVDLLLGLLQPDVGQVLVDGVDIHLDLRSWQDQIGYVPQSVFLADDTLAHNVAFGLTDADIDTSAVWRALRAAQLEDFARSQPEGLETTVGERGARLSGGQRQRIGIARALYHNPSVLVLDEATSALDVATEREVMQSVRALHGSKTIVIVAHRSNTVEQCDRVYTLDSGGIAERRNGC